MCRAVRIGMKLVTLPIVLLYFMLMFLVVSITIMIARLRSEDWKFLLTELKFQLSTHFRFLLS